jgi:hypothetical protein
MQGTPVITDIFESAPTGTAVVARAPGLSGVAGLQPATAIAIAVDTQYVASQGGGGITQGIYMFDNRLDNGSKGEGGLELSTKCNAGDLIGFEIYPITELGTSGDTVSITGFNVSQGDVFGSQGFPMQQTPNYWIGQAINAGSQTYQIRAQIKTGGLRPTVFNVYWDPYITAQ